MNSDSIPAVRMRPSGSWRGDWRQFEDFGRTLLFQFEDFVLDPERRELRRAAHRVAVEPQVFDLV